MNNRRCSYTLKKDLKMFRRLNQYSTILYRACIPILLFILFSNLSHASTKLCTLSSFIPQINTPIGETSSSSTDMRSSILVENQLSGLTLEGNGVYLAVFGGKATWSFNKPIYDVVMQFNHFEDENESISILLYDENNTIIATPEVNVSTPSIQTTTIGGNVTLTTSNTTLATSENVEVRIPHNVGVNYIIITQPASQPGVVWRMSSHCTLVDTDGDGIADSNETNDSDGDNISDFLESNTTDSDNDGVVDQYDVNNTDPTSDSDGDNISDNNESNLSTNPLDNTSTPTDTDGDNNPDALDTDDDNDGLSDTNETALGTNTTNPDTDGDGISDSNETNDSDGDNIIDALESKTIDSDGDGVANQYDVNNTNPNSDSDGDNINDKDETSSGHNPLDNSSNPTDTDGDNIIDTNDIDDDNDGILDSVENVTYTTSDKTASTTTSAIDTDGDGKLDRVDTDSDNDGIPDAIEGHDANKDGVADVKPSGTDSDADGLDDAFDPDHGGKEASIQDMDDDGIPDFKDNDDDGDGIPTANELQDNDGDGTLDYLEVNDKLQAINDTLTVATCNSIASNTVSTNDQLPSGANYTFELESTPNHGSVDFEKDGTYIYTANEGYEGNDTFSYRIIGTNGTESVASVNINVRTMQDGDSVDALNPLWMLLTLLTTLLFARKLNKRVY
jgi:hypothetical protein